MKGILIIGISIGPYSVLKAINHVLEIMMSTALICTKSGKIGIFARFGSFVRMKPSRNGEITLSFTDVGKSCPSREFLTWHLCILTLFAKKKILAKFPDSQYTNYETCAILHRFHVFETAKLNYNKLYFKECIYSIC